MTIPPSPTTENEISVTREELYDQVWSEPMWTLAARFGLSDVGLAKTCRRHQVPVPPRGYWARKQAGQVVKPTKLPKLSVANVEQLGTITFRRRTSSKADGEPDAKVETPTISVPDVLTDPHPLVAHSIRTLRRVKPAKNGMLHPDVSSDCLDIRVSLTSVDRAMRIMDSLVRACEERGYAISLEVTEKATVTKVIVDEMSLGVHLDETIQSVPIPPEEQKHHLHRFSFQAEPRKDVPTGELAFHIEGSWYWCKENVRRAWRDGKKQRLEACIGSIIVGMQHAALAMKTSNALYAEHDRQRKEEDGERKRKAWVEHVDKKHREYITSDLAKFRTIGELREYVRFRRSRQENPSEVLEEWLTWVSSYADRLEAELLKYAGPKTEPFNENSYYY